MKDKTKKIIQVSILVLLILLGSVFITYDDVYAYIGKTTGIDETTGGLPVDAARETFRNDGGIENVIGVSTYLYQDYGISLWCIRHGGAVGAYMTADQAIGEAYDAGETSDNYEEGTIVWEGKEPEQEGKPGWTFTTRKIYGKFW